MTPDSILELFGSSGVENVLRLNTGKLVAVMFILEVVHEIKRNAKALNKHAKLHHFSDNSCFYVWTPCIDALSSYAIVIVSQSSKLLHVKVKQ
jgi:hypothetical protein